MTVRTLEKDRRRLLQEHLDLAVALDPSEAEGIRRLAAQLQDLRVLPLLGAGASFDCGVRLAREIGDDLYRDYMADPAYENEPRDAVAEDLADVAQAIHNATDQVGVVRALGLPDADLWPDPLEVDEHFCAYRVLARLVREDFFEEAIGFNYDCDKEAALLREGFLRSPRTIAGQQWRDHMTVIADKETFYNLQRDGALTYVKAHGCAQRFREIAITDETGAAETIIVRRSQLTNWRNDAWVRDRLRDRARTHALLLIGFSAQDPAIHGELQVILDEIDPEMQSQEVPRVVVIDWQPNTPTLRGLIKTGLGGADPQDGVTTQVAVSRASTTAALLMLLAETLRLRLEPHLASEGYSLPSDVDAQLAALLITAPLMLRWSYLLSPHSQDHFMQKINLEWAAGGYVPLTADRRITALALGTRAEVRHLLGRPPEESTRQGLGDHGFLTQGGFAFMPVAMDFEALLSACRPGGPVERAQAILSYPTHLECVLVTRSSSGLRGVNMATGAEIDLPT